MNPHNGTSITNWSHFEQIARKMTVDQLKFSIEDATQARDNAPEHANFPCKAQGFYADEVHVYTMELERRKNKLTATQKVKILTDELNKVRRHVKKVDEWVIKNQPNLFDNDLFNDLHNVFVESSPSKILEVK
jgi:hypothetical protein